MKKIKLFTFATLAAIAAICASCSSSTKTDFDEDDPSLARDVRYVTFWITNYVTVEGDESGEVFEGAMAFTFRQYVDETESIKNNSNIKVASKNGLIHYECEGNDLIEYSVQEIKQDNSAKLSFDIDPQSKTVKNLVFTFNGKETRVVTAIGWASVSMETTARQHASLSDFPFNTYTDGYKEAKWSVADGLEFYDFLSETDVRFQEVSSSEVEFEQSVCKRTNDSRDYVWLIIDYV